MPDLAALQQLPPNLLAAVVQAQLELARIGPDFGELLQQLAARAAGLVQADGAVVELVEEDEIVYRATFGMADPQLGLRMPIRGSLSGLCLSSNSAAICTDSETDPRVNLEACRRVGLRAMTIVPMSFDAQAAGVLKLMWREPRGLDCFETETGMAVASMAAALMHHAALQGGEELRRRVTSDPATGLPNRAYFHELLRQRLAQAETGAAQLGVLLFAVGEPDKPLAMPEAGRAAAVQEISRRILNQCRPGDVVTRIGPGLFALLLSVAGRRSVVLSQATRIMQAVTSEPLEVSLRLPPLPLPVACAVALYPDSGRSVGELLYTAQTGLIAAAAGERGTLRFVSR